MLGKIGQSVENRVPGPGGRGLGKMALAAGLLGGALLVTHGPAMAQSHGGGHGGGGGGGYHGGGGGYHGGGYHGGGYHGGGYGHGFYGHGYYGGWYGGYYPWFGLGYDAFYDPFWAYGPYGYGYDVDGPSYDGAPGYAAGAGAPPPGYVAQGYPPQSYPQQAYGPPSSGPQSYGPQGTVQVTPGSGGGTPTDNSRGFYRWPVGIQSGTCNRPFIQQTALTLTGASPRPGESEVFLGGISVAPVIGGRIGSRLDATDQACATESLELAQTGQTVAWASAAGVLVTFQVTRTLQQGNGDCRDYVVTAQFGSHTNTVSGKACKQSNGSWVAAG